MRPPLFVFVPDILIIIVSPWIIAMKACMTNHYIVALATGILYLSADVSAKAAIGDAWIGLKGEELKHAVAASCAPTAYHTVSLGDDGLWEIFKHTDSDPSGGGYIDRFSGIPLEFAPSLSEGPPEATLVNVVGISWWKPESDMQFGVLHDLYNLFLSRIGIDEWKWFYPPGSVVDFSYTNGIWGVGRGFMGGTGYMFWDPPKGYEGDVARVMMYMLTVYRDGLITFGGDGAAYASRNYYPGISTGGVRQLLAWHRSDPVDELERVRNAEFSRWQGNLNPFVEYPLLAEYLWGYRAGAEFDREALGSEMPGAGSSGRFPLKGVYNVSDERIDLFHPAVPAGAVWNVDGTPVMDDYLIPSRLGIGVHELRFESDGLVGKVLIEICQ